MKRWLWPSTLLLTACGGAPEGSDLPRPSADTIIVYFPVGDGSRGLVRGRAFPGTFPADAVPPFATVRSLPTTVGGAVVDVDLDGGFDFSVVASGGEVLEVSGSRDPSGEVRGPSVFVQVPPAPFPTTDHVCCRPSAGAAGICIPNTPAERALRGLEDENDRISEDCPDRDPTLIEVGSQVECRDDPVCGILEREYYRITEDDVQITPPDEEGTITISGNTIPNGLVLIQNRGLNGVGDPSPVRRQSLIANPDGSFEVIDVTARGDDELVIQVVDLNDFRTPQLSKKVPDAPLRRAELMEAWPASELSTDQSGFVGLRFTLTGVDGRGICPDSDADPAYCLSGGLTYDQIQILDARIDDTPVTLCKPVAEDESPPMRGDCARDDPLSLDRPRRGIEGDVRGGPQRVVVIVDLSADSLDVAGRENYFVFLEDYIRGLKQDDRVALLSIGADDRGTEFFSFEQRDGLIDILRAWSALMPSGDTTLFDAVARAAAQVSNNRGESGRILLTALSPETNLPDLATPNNAFDRAVDRVQADLRFDGIPVDVVGVNLTKPGATANDPSLEELLQNLAQFSGNGARPGRVYRLPGDVLPSVLDLQLLFRDALGQYAGGFLMLYELLPQRVELNEGKVGTLSIRAQVTLASGAAIETVYSGPLEFARVAEN